MMSLALSLTVLTSSGGMLAGHLPAGVRLLDAPARLPGTLVAAARPAISEYLSMSVPQLKEEWLRLEDEKPGLGGGITLTVLGGVFLIGGVSTFLYSVLNWAALTQDVLVGLFLGGIVGAVAGLVLVIVGPILIGVVAGQRHRVEREQEAVRAQIQYLEGGGGTTPLPTGPLPPPPPPPYSGLGHAPPLVTVASF
jgi:hypothetical protein